jgi:hypothetical protein
VEIETHLLGGRGPVRTLVAGDALHQEADVAWPVLPKPPRDTDGADGERATPDGDPRFNCTDPGGAPGAVVVPRAKIGRDQWLVLLDLDQEP